MITVLDQNYGLSSSPGQGHCVVFLSKALHSSITSLHPGVQMGTGEFNTGGNPVMYYHRIQGGGEILLVTSGSAAKTGYTQWPDGLLGLNVDFTCSS